jgi:predicted GIY-YIG superfamily endonuclease
MFYLYILKNDRDVFYVGQTNSLDRRIADHRTKQGAKFTKYTDGLQLVYSEELKSRAEAMKREKQLKKWSKAKKLALVSGDTEKLKQLSKRRS